MLMLGTRKVFCSKWRKVLLKSCGLFVIKIFCCQSPTVRMSWMKTVVTNSQKASKRCYEQHVW
ncbi:hypothetical protein DPMN_136903 [Dreissena polymorpha]|uniref:Uncharacterized protein n=1 Tax=Dreissena polymorpha TaxID=45954 RepID=A0A9D4G1L8_DREPO|nr:hypothetical protein DPMN_136903 [Dreissena polymorpha]